jgi:hypothetical protein
MTRFRLLLPLAVLALLPPPRAAAWGEVGHATVAKLAWDRMTDGQKLKAAALLKSHPHHKLFLAANRPDGVSEAEWTFLRAANWPDWVKPQGHPDTRVDDPTMPGSPKVTRFHREDDHFINTPLVRGNVPAPKAGPQNIVAALKANTYVLKSDAADPDKAVALCWLLHLTGDIHQPLHCAVLVSEQFPAQPGHQVGDVGGNLFVLKIEGKPVRLHGYWDELPGDLAGGVMVNTPAHEKRLLKMVNDNAERLRDPALGRDKLPELTQNKDFPAWAVESFKLAEEVAYKDGDEDLKGVRVPFGPLNVDPDTLPAASDDYVKKAKATADRRLALAGFRLADQMAALFESR